MSKKEKDIEHTSRVYEFMNNFCIQQQIDKLYEKMDVCDDMRMRAVLARKVRNLKKKMI